MPIPCQYLLRSELNGSLLDYNYGKLHETGLDYVPIQDAALTPIVKDDLKKLSGPLSDEEIKQFLIDRGKMDKITEELIKGIDQEFAWLVGKVNGVKK